MSAEHLDAVCPSGDALPGANGEQTDLAPMTGPKSGEARRAGEDRRAADGETPGHREHGAPDRGRGRAAMSRGSGRGRRGGWRTLGAFDPFNQRSAPETNFTRYYTMEAKKSGAKLSKLDWFGADREIIQALGGEPNLITNEAGGALDGAFRIEVKNREQGESLLKITQVMGEEVSVRPHPTCNQSKGTFIFPDFNHMTEGEILASLTAIHNPLDPLVLSVRRMGRRRGAVTEQTSRYVLTFGSNQTPRMIRVRPGVTVDVEQYLPEPKRCFKCQGWGHTTGGCKPGTPEICVNCGQISHGRGACERPSCCANCGDAHPASSKTCEQYLVQRETIRIMVAEAVSYREARRRAADRLPNRGSYAGAVRGRRNAGQPEQRQADHGGNARKPPPENVRRETAAKPNEPAPDEPPASIPVVTGQGVRNKRRRSGSSPLKTDTAKMPKGSNEWTSVSNRRSPALGATIDNGEERSDSDRSNAKPVPPISESLAELRKVIQGAASMEPGAQSRNRFGVLEVDAPPDTELRPGGSTSDAWRTAPKAAQAKCSNDDDRLKQISTKDANIARATAAGSVRQTADRYEQMLSSGSHEEDEPNIRHHSLGSVRRRGERRQPTRSSRDPRLQSSSPRRRGSGGGREMRPPLPLPDYPLPTHYPPTNCNRTHDTKGTDRTGAQGDPRPYGGTATMRDMMENRVCRVAGGPDPHSLSSVCTGIPLQLEDCGGGLLATSPPRSTPPNENPHPNTPISRRISLESVEILRGHSSPSDSESESSIRAEQIYMSAFSADSYYSLSPHNV